MGDEGHDGGMSTSYVPYQPDQQYLMPCALDEWLPKGHLGKVFKTPSKPEWCELGVSEKIAE
jgi:hypothetical protein